MRHTRTDPAALKDGRARAVAALLLTATNDEAEAIVLRAAGDHVMCSRRQDSAARARALAAQIGSPTI